MSFLLRSVVFLIAFLFLFLFISPSSAFACSGANQAPGSPVLVGGSCQPACGGSATNFQGDIRFTYTDGSTCTEVRYFSDSGCGSPGGNQCPATCSSDAECGAGICAGAGTSATDFCENGNRGDAPRFCQGFNCGYECIPPSTCRRNGPGQGFGGFGDQVSCTNFCKTGYSCINNSCQGGVFGGTWATQGECLATGCGTGPTPPPTPAPTSTSPPAPGCYNCPEYPDFNCPIAGQSRLCHFQSQVPGCADGGAWSVGACQGSCGACSGGGPLPTPPPPVSTPPPPCACLGVGAGCGNVGNCGCCGGLSCHNGTCGGGDPPPPYCEYAALGAARPITPGYNEAGVPSAIPNWNLGNDVAFNFNWEDLPPRFPGGGACSGSGRSFEIKIGVCEDGVTWYDPSRCGPAWYQERTPNTRDWGTGNTWVDQGSTGPGSARFTIPQGHVNWDDISGWLPRAACWNGAGFNCDPSEYPPLFNGVRTSTYWYQIRNDCACDGFFDPKFSPTWVFTYYGSPPPPPATPTAPTLICLASGSGDDNDICDVSQGPPLGYGGGRDSSGSVMRYNLNARDGGPAGTRQPFYTHGYTITDITPGLGSRTLPPATGPNNGPSALFTLDTRTISNPPAPGGVGLQNGHTYDWFVITSDNATPANPAPNSPPSATWRFLYDITNPTVGIINSDACFDITSPPPNFTVTTSDPGTPTQASNIRTLTAVITNETGATVSTQDLMPSCGWGGFPVGQGNGVCSVNTSTLTPNHTYTITATSTDNAGNSSTTSTTFVFQPICIGPWLQSTGGDVHSNTGVNTPGGPP